MYDRYEKAVHKKDRTRDQMKRFVCSSPVYDANKEEDELQANRSAPFNFETVDEGKVFKDEGVFPG